MSGEERPKALFVDLSGTEDDVMVQLRKLDVATFLKLQSAMFKVLKAAGVLDLK